MTRTIIHFIDTEIFGGCEEVALLLLAGLDRQFWRPILFHYGAPGISHLVYEADRLGIPSHVVPRITARNLAVTLPRFMSELHALQPAIIHVHLNWPLGCRYAVTAARLSRVPGIIATAHLVSSLERVRFARLKHRIHAASIDRYLAVSEEVKRRLCTDLRIPDAKVNVVRNGIRLAPFECEPDPQCRTMITGGVDRPIVLTLARLHSQKGQGHLLEAAVLVPDALFVLAGDGPERQSLEEQARRLGIAERVRFLGQREDIPQLLASCDLFVLPSLYEGLPLSVLEAMAAGKPVVATRIGGTDEAVLDGVTGLLVAPASPAELAAAIRQVLGDPALAARFATAGRERVREEFSATAMVRRVADEYEDLLSATS